MGELEELIRESDRIISKKTRDRYMAVYMGESDGDKLKVLVKDRKRVINIWSKVREIDRLWERYQRFD